jgi:putative Holliday junction resolvase
MTRIIGIDIGTVRVGVALSDEEQMIASPLVTLEARPRSSAVRDVAAIVDEHEATALVYGLPFNLDGTEGRAAKRTRRFIRALESELDIPCMEWDERMTSVVAERTLIEADMSRKKRKKVVDQVAATLILQSWLDANSNKARNPR